MSRPPRFRTAYSSTGEPLPGRSVLDYLPDDFGDFVDEERSLAASELGFPPSPAEGDFAGTLMELSALVAHVLGVYQDRYANDAFLGTAQSPKNLVRHGRRLAYEPSPGLSAIGYAVLTVKEGLSGTVEKGLAIGSAPAGEKKAQDYETLEDTSVDAALGELLPLDSLSSITLAEEWTFWIEGTGHDIEEGELVVVERTDGHLLGVEVAAVRESGGRTEITLKDLLPNADHADAVLWAKPAHDVHLFGWDTSPTELPEDKLQGGLYDEGSPPGVGVTAYGYAVAPTYDPNEIYLAEELPKSVEGSPVVEVTAGAAWALSVSQGSQAAKNVTFKKVEHIQVPAPEETVVDLYPTVSVSKTVTALVVTDGGVAKPRSSHSIRTSRFLLGFQVKADIVTKVPNETAITAPDATPVVLDREVTGLQPGRLVAITQREKTDAEAADKDEDAPRFEIVRLTSVSTVDLSGKTYTAVQWQAVEPSVPGDPFELGDFRILGNVAAISHGKTVSEVLGDSDGSKPFLRFALKQTPLTHLPSSDGAEPALEVRVADVLWTRVRDFESSSRDDRHYVLQIDENGTVEVVFGDGQKGAIPASGKKHIAATYRIGIGTDGDAPALAVSRLKKAHPLLERAENPRPVSGGAAPAAAEDIRARATGYIRTFDRAVSVADHKHLALLYPGIAKANATWASLPSGAEGVLLVVADESGGAGPLDEVKAFLQARRDDTVPLHVQGPTLVGLRMSLRLEIDPAYLKEIVERAVRDALAGDSTDAPGLFTFAARDLGQPAFLSEVYERIEAVPGVRFIEVARLDTLEEVLKGTPTRVVDTLVAHADEVLVIASNDIDFLSPEAR